MAAFDFSKLNFFKRLDARARVLVLMGGVLGMLLLVYLITRLLSGGSNTIGPSRVAGAPQGMQSVPGGTTQSAEFQRALMQANQQRAEVAKMTGQSAVPTEMNTGLSGVPGGSQCNIICSDTNAKVNNLLDQWVKEGKVSADVAKELEALADKNVSVEDYAANLNRLVREGKLTPEQARELLEQYKKQHASALLQDSAKTMDDLIKSGQLPLDVANQLLTAQKNHASPSEYAAMLAKLVAEGKITPEVAQRLLAQYTQQYAKEVIMRSIAELNQWSKNGEITPDVLRDLIALENQMVPIDTVTAALKKYVDAGKLTPAVSSKILAEYKQQKSEIGPGGSLDQLIQQAEAAAFLEISTLLKEGKITPDIAAGLTDMIQRNVSLDEYKAAVNQWVSQNKMTPEIAKLKIGDYTTVKQLRDMQSALTNLAANNASVTDYANELKKAVAAGILTPEQAAQMLADYQAMSARGAPTLAGTPGTAQFAAMQQQLQQGTPQIIPGGPGGFVAPQQVQVVTETDQERQLRLQTIMAAMSGQAQQLISSWQPPVMEHRSGSYDEKRSDKTMITSTEKQIGGGSLAGTSGAPLIKAGTILFAVLDTGVNSDYPDSPVLATVVMGNYKGAKLLGKLTTTKGVAGQLDRIMLNFTLMNEDQWPKSKAITAYAIDPDTARSVLASSVNYHYLQRFGAIFATSFVQGYANAISSSGSTTTTGIFGTSTTHPELSPSQKFMTAIGQIGQNLSTITQNYVNIPPTVRVDSGVSLGILFMADVS